MRGKAFTVIWVVLGLFLCLNCVLAVNGTTTFVVSASFEEVTGCTRHQFELKNCTAAIRFNVNTDNKGTLIYAYDTSKGLYSSFSNRKCGNNTLTAKSVKKDSEMLVVRVCGYSASMCPVVCSQTITCEQKDHGLDPPPTEFNVSKFMCSPQDEGQTAVQPDSNSSTCTVYQVLFAFTLFLFVA